jgi:hypothetical protein
VPHKPQPPRQPTLKAGAPICPICLVELLEAEVDVEINGTILRKLKVLRCPICLEEQFTEQQQKALEQQLRQTETKP